MRRMSYIPYRMRSKRGVVAHYHWTVQEPWCAKIREAMGSDYRPPNRLIVVSGNARPRFKQYSAWGRSRMSWIEVGEDWMIAEFGMAYKTMVIQEALTS